MRQGLALVCFLKNGTDFCWQVGLTKNPKESSWTGDFITKFQIFCPNYINHAVSLPSQQGTISENHDLRKRQKTKKHIKCVDERDLQGEEPKNGPKMLSRTELRQRTSPTQ